MSITSDQLKTLNTAVSGVKVSLSHVNWLVSQGVCDVSIKDDLRSVADRLDAIVISAMGSEITGGA